MIKSLLLFASGTFLAFTSVMWVAVFWLMMPYGGVVLVEPNPNILWAEFYFASALFLVGIVCAMIGVHKARRREL